MNSIALMLWEEGKCRRGKGVWRDEKQVLESVSLHKETSERGWISRPAREGPGSPREWLVVAY